MRGMPPLKRDYFKGKRITVFGIGLNGGTVGAIEFLIQSGAREIIATDIRSREELAPSLERLKPLKNIIYVLGQHRPEDFTNVDMIVKNPGIPWTNEYIRRAQEKGIPVEMDVSIFFQLVKNQTIGVTGTRGKSTTAALIAHLLEQADYPVVRVGINQTGFLSELPKISEKSVIVAELSSWRLSALRRMAWSPQVAVVTNFFPDHQNYYKSLEAYARDKQTIVEFQSAADWAVLNFDHEKVRSWGEKTQAQKRFFSQLGQGVMDGVSLVGRQVVEYTQGNSQPLLTLTTPGLAGVHNQANALAAIAVARVHGLTPANIMQALETFRGLPHRFELIAQKRGVQYINDTAATSPEALLAALDTCPVPPVLIAGGADKDFDFAHLPEVLLDRTKALVLLQGTGTEKLLPSLEKIIEDRKLERVIPVVTTMRDAIALAEENAVAGDRVLLSPGMASFGLFKNEFDRGEQFRDGVEALPE